jgi:hypothetical protein
VPAHDEHVGTVGSVPVAAIILNEVLCVTLRDMCSLLRDKAAASLTGT